VPFVILLSALRLGLRALERFRVVMMLKNGPDRHLKIVVVWL